MNFDIGIVVILLLGILLGLIIGNKRFRISFFKGLRKFLAGLGSSARAYSAQQQSRGGKRETRQPPQPESEIKHHYIADHHLVACPKCKGTGRLKKKAPAILDKKLFGEQTEKCPDCEGTGKVFD